jgi:arylsulfatase A-like enzyme
MSKRQQLSTAPVAASILCLFGACGDAAPTTPRPNILLITVDTLRADHLEPYGYPRPTSPALARLASEAMVFEDAQASAPWTLPSFASLLTGLPAAAHGCRSFYSSLAPSYGTLAEDLLAGGYDTAAVVSHVFLGRPYGLHQGFVHFDDELVLEMTRSDEVISSPAVSDKGLAYLEAKAGSPKTDDEPWFLWLHYFDPHAVYQAHGSQVAAFGSERVIDLYDGEIAFTDGHIGRVLDGLKLHGYDENTVVVFTSDHGEEFKDHGGLEHGHTLYQELLHQPLIIRAPGAEVGRYPEMVRSLDVPATLLDYAQLPPAQESLGMSLRPALEGTGVLDLPPALVELDRNEYRNQIGLVTTETKFIIDRRTDTPMLFERDKDPREKRDRSGKSPAEVLQLRAELRVLHEAALGIAAKHTDRVDLDIGAAEMQDLNKTGYAGDEADE